MIDNPLENPIRRSAEAFGFTVDDKGKLHPPSQMKMNERKREADLAKNRVLREFMEDWILPLVKDNHDGMVALSMMFAQFANIAVQRHSASRGLLEMLPDDIHKAARTERCMGVCGTLSDQIEEFGMVAESIPSDAVNEGIARMTAYFAAQECES